MDSLFIMTLFSKEHPRRKMFEIEWRFFPHNVYKLVFAFKAGICMFRFHSCSVFKINQNSNICTFILKRVQRKQHLRKKSFYFPLYHRVSNNGVRVRLLSQSPHKIKLEPIRSRPATLALSSFTLRKVQGITPLNRLISEVTVFGTKRSPPLLFTVGLQL